MRKDYKHAARVATHNREMERQTLAQFAGAVALSACALAMILMSLNASAEITQDCILEGTVDKRKADQLGQPVYVAFRDAERASDATCSMNRRKKSRRVKFVSKPDMADIVDAEHGTRVRYRYTEHDSKSANWQLVEVKSPNGDGS